MRDASAGALRGLVAGSAVGSLRDDALTRDAKVLLLVDFAHSADREVTAAGADERLAMPFSPLQLQVKLRKLLGPEADLDVQQAVEAAAEQAGAHGTTIFFSSHQLSDVEQIADHIVITDAAVYGGGLAVSSSALW